MKDHIEPEKVLVPTPQPVKVREQIRASDWIPPVCALLVVVMLVYTVGMIMNRIGEMAAASVAVTEPATDTMTEAMSVYAWEPCTDCMCPAVEDVQFLGRWMDALTKLEATPLEIWDLTHRAFIESRFNPVKVSPSGDYGICQINKKAHPEVAVTRLLTDADYAAVECLNVYRTYTNLCGNDWQCCYKRGHKGCRDWKAGK